MLSLFSEGGVSEPFTHIYDFSNFYIKSLLGLSHTEGER